MGRFTDYYLVRRVLRGDERAFGRLFELHSAAVYRALVHLCRDTHWAEDLTQQTFLCAWKHMADYEGRCSLKTWLHRIAYRLFVDWWRRRQVQAAAQGRLREQPSPVSLSPLDGAVSSESSERLALAVDRLDPASRELIVLHYFQGLSLREVAQVLDLPTGTVKGRASVALTRLRGMLQRGDSREYHREVPRALGSVGTGAGAASSAEADHP